MPDGPIPGRSLVTRRAIADIARSATLGSYGVAGFAAGPVERIRAFFEGRPAGLRAAIVDGRVAIELRLRVGHGLPIAEVARQVDSGVRYAIRRALGVEVATLSIRIGGLEARPAGAPPEATARSGTEPPVPADPGTDVV